MWFGDNPTFQRNKLPPSSGSKSKLSIKLGEAGSKHSCLLLVVSQIAYFSVPFIVTALRTSNPALSILTNLIKSGDLL
jgi:hypothetical protein